VTIIVHAGHHEHQQVAAKHMVAGLERHGLTVRWNEHRPCDVAIVWGGKQRERVVGEAGHVLVMERGHVGDRMAMTSCGWDGLGRRGHYPRATDGGARWRARYHALMAPWTERVGYVLVIGQVDGDAALGGLDVARWRVEIEQALVARGHVPKFRPHPVMARPRRSLAEDLSGAELCVTYNSTTGVEAVLAGVPTVTLDPGAMAWPVTVHELEAPPLRPDRTAWAADLAWTQWTLEEIANGDAWAALEPVREG
jgi:hypothetical protein